MWPSVISCVYTYDINNNTRFRNQTAKFYFPATTAAHTREKKKAATKKKKAAVKTKKVVVKVKKAAAKKKKVEKKKKAAAKKKKVAKKKSTEKKKEAAATKKRKAAAKKKKPAEEKKKKVEKKKKATKKKKNLCQRAVVLKLLLSTGGARIEKKEKFCSCFKSFSYFIYWIFQKKQTARLVHLHNSSSIKYTRDV